MRILLVTLYFRPIGGLEKYTIAMAEALQKCGAEVSIVTVFHSDKAELPNSFSIRELEFRGPLLRRVYHRTWRFWLKRYLHGHPALDLIIAGHLWVVPEVHAYAAKKGIPYWVCMYGIEAWGQWTQSQTKAVKASNKIVSISHYTASAIEQKLGAVGSQLAIIPPAVDTIQYSPQRVTQKSPGYKLLTVGRLSSAEQYKGHDLVIRALPTLISKVDRPIEYWIVGDGDDRDRLEQLSKECGVSGIVRFWGSVPEQQLIELYHSCDIYIMPSQVYQRPDGSWAGEGFGIVYIEAAACGKPVIAANQGGAADAVKHGVTGFLVEPNVDTLVTAIMALLENDELRDLMGKSGREFVQNHFSLGEFERRWAELLTPQE